MTTPTVPQLNADVTAYLAAVWWDQPNGTAATDAAYLAWEQAWDQLCADAEAGIPAALEAQAVINNEVEAAIRRVRAEATT